MVSQYHKTISQREKYCKTDYFEVARASFFNFLFVGFEKVCDATGRSEEGFALAFNLRQLFTEVGAHLDRPLAGVIHHLETFDDVPDFIVGVVTSPFSHRFLEKNRPYLD